MMHKTKIGGFTLIELLVVIVVILLLSGMLFQVGSLVSDRSNRARAIADMQAIANALEEYYAVYGMYPPTTGMRYEYPDRSPNMQPPQMDGIPAEGLAYGLASYLYARGRDDPRRDGASEDVKARWQHYLAELNTRRPTVGREMDPGEGTLAYSNRVLNVINPWNRPYQYESRAPYLSYRLWTGVPNSDEDLSVSSAGQ